MNRKAQTQSTFQKKKPVVQLALFLCSFMLFFLLFSHIFTGVASVGWEKSRKLTNKNFQIESYNSAQKGNLAVISFFGTDKNKEGIYFSLSYDGGENFTPPRLLAEPASGEFSKTLVPRCAVSTSGKISIIWQDFSGEDSSYHLYIALSHDRGKEWAQPQTINLANESEMLPVLFYDELERLHIIYHAINKDEMHIFHTTYIDGAPTEPTQLSLDESRIRGAFFPSVEIEGNRIYVVWQGKESAQTLHDDLYFVSSLDYGKTWSRSKRITFNEYDDNSPALVLSGETLYLVFINNEQSNWELYFKRGLNFGEVWEEKASHVFSTNVNCLSPVFIRENSDRLHLFWHQPAGEHSQIFTATYSIPENTFSSPVQITDKSEDSAYPSTFSSDIAINTIWLEGSSLYSSKTDTYAAPPRISSPTHPQGKWSQFASAEIHWTPPRDESGIAGYATIVNREKYFDPTVQNIDASTLQTNVPFLPDGISYFHIRTVDKAGNYSRTLHYPLYVSSNPLSTPRIASSSHEEGKASDKKDARFSWSLDDSERVNGYYYHLAPGSAKVPDTFTKDKSLSFNGLKDGRYFLTLRAVDKAGNPGRIATFELLVGDVEAIDAREYEKMAQEMESADQIPTEVAVNTERETNNNLSNNKPSEEEGGAELNRPLKKITLSFTTSDQRDNQKLQFRITYDSNGEAPSSSVFTYTLFRDGKFVLSGQTETGIVELEDMKSGDYTVQATGRYSYNDDSPQRMYQTETISREYSYLPVFTNPVENFYSELTSIFMVNWQLYSLFILSMVSSLLFSLWFFRIYFAIRVFLSRLIHRMMLIFH